MPSFMFIHAMALRHSINWPVSSHPLSALSSRRLGLSSTARRASPFARRRESCLSVVVTIVFQAGSTYIVRCPAWRMDRSLPALLRWTFLSSPTFLTYSCHEYCSLCSRSGPNTRSLCFKPSNAPSAARGLAG
jgi:hypothetical protein